MIFDDTMIKLSASNYIDDLRALRAKQLSDACRVTADEIIRSVSAALKYRDQLQSDQAPDLRPLLNRVPLNEREYLVNQSSLGVGRADADVLVVGQEHAYNLDDVDKLAVEGCGLTTL